MKRAPGMTDAEWDALMAERKALAEERMALADMANPKMFGIIEVERAAKAWYGKTCMDACCMAENRLERGERPPVQA